MLCSVSPVDRSVSPVGRRRYAGAAHGLLWVAGTLGDDVGRYTDDLDGDVPAVLGEGAHRER